MEEIKVVQGFDENYYEESYNEWLFHRSKFLKWSDKLGFLCLGIGLIGLIFIKSWMPIFVGMLFLGLSLLYEFYSNKAKWLKDRKASKVNNQSATLIFEDEKVQSSGPFSEAIVDWEFFKDAIETEKGLFLILENKTNIYLQKKSFERLEDVDLILNKIKQLKK